MKRILVIFFGAVLIGNIAIADENTKEETVWNRIMFSIGAGVENTSFGNKTRFNTWIGIEYPLASSLNIKIISTPVIIYGQETLGILCMEMKYIIKKSIFFDMGFGYTSAGKDLNSENINPKFGFGWCAGAGYNFNIKQNIILAPEFRYYGSNIAKKTYYNLTFGLGFYFRFI